MFYRISSPTSPQWVMALYEGPDLADFLERLSTVSIRSLPQEQGRAGCFLNAQGRIISSFFLWRFSESQFGFEMENTPTAIRDLDQWIEQYRFSERFAKGQVLSASGLVFSEEGFLDLNALHCLHQNIFHHGDLVFGKPWISVYGSSWEKWSSSQELNSGDLQEVGESQIEEWRIRNLGPRSGHEISSDVSPLELGMVFWVARGKGCYPGQEVIERTFTYGSPSQRLVEVELTSPPKSPISLPLEIQNLAGSPIEIGRLTSLANGRGLAVVKKIHAKADLPFQIQMESGPIIGRILRVSSFEGKS